MQVHDPLDLEADCVKSKQWKDPERDPTPCCSSLLALTIACRAGEARTLEFGCKFLDLKYSKEFAECFAFCFLERSLERGDYLNMNYTMFVFKKVGPTKVQAESDKLEKFTDIVLDGSYLTFKRSFRQLGFFFFLGTESNRSLLKCLRSADFWW